MEEAIDALEDADLIVLGPGSLYTSVISLCVKGMSEAIYVLKHLNYTYLML